MNWQQQLAEYRQHLADIMKGVALGRYEHELRQQTAELNDLFLLLCFMEATALPNPATLYLLEVYPYLLEQFHVWHRRMGIEHSPIGSLPAAELAPRSAVIFFRGKGDVGGRPARRIFAGREPVATACAFVSTDPAHSTTDIFEHRSGRAMRTAANLSALGDRSRWRGGATSRSHGTSADVQPEVVRQAHSQIEMAAASPGLLEVALLDRMIELIVNRGRAYDTVVFDTAPTGHTMQLLRMPEAITTWIQALVKHRRAIIELDRGGEQTREASAAADPVLEALERRHERLAQLRTILTDRRRTSFVLVAVPERLVIEETARAAEQLAETGIDVGGLIVNRVLPEGLEGEFYQARKAQETVYLREIERRFRRLPRVLVHQLPRDVCGLASLGLVSSQLVSPEGAASRRGHP